ncbi:hypothetical protein HAX54_045651 [Datura stramonium]|uniref:Uncharacterized protein n=1 Tax=Datura stramonium TaxID=4076 RepID=A0ABS8RPQ0_DATST|nr:hypothetical protein [Datura stramonium]
MPSNLHCLDPFCLFSERMCEESQKDGKPSLLQNLFAYYVNDMALPVSRSFMSLDAPKPYTHFLFYTSLSIVRHSLESSICNDLGKLSLAIAAFVRANGQMFCNRLACQSSVDSGFECLV